MVADYREWIGSLIQTSEFLDVSQSFEFLQIGYFRKTTEMPAFDVQLEDFIKTGIRISSVPDTNEWLSNGIRTE